MSDYKSKLSLRDTQRAIKLVKDTFQVLLGAALNLDRVTAPVIVKANRGINDDLSGSERKVSFDLLAGGDTAEVVQSLAKWKRMALQKYGYTVGEGIYTDMNAIRRDDRMDELHSVFVDQWDWERVISPEQRSREFLHEMVRRIVQVIISTQQIVQKSYPVLCEHLCEEVSFVTTEELLQLYPSLTPEQREYEYVRAHGTAFIEQIGWQLSDGKPHDGRAPDYDDWRLNGDIFFYSPVLDRAVEVSSMGIRVDSDSLRLQLSAAGAEDRMRYEYHRAVADGSLPLTVGGGIGQSRLCMLMLEKAHIGEVQVSVWSDAVEQSCEAKGIKLL